MKVKMILLFVFTLSFFGSYGADMDSLKVRLKETIDKTEAYLERNQKGNPSYSQVFFKFLNKSKCAKIDIDSNYYNNVIQDNSICLLQALFTKKPICNKSPKYIVDSLLKINDTVSALIIIGLNPTAMNKNKANKLFNKLKYSTDKYTITHLYFALKMAERSDINFLDINSKRISILLTPKLKEYLNPNNVEIDLYLETLALLTEFDNVMDYKSEIKNVLNLQNSDGGWSWRKDLAESNLHSTFLSLWYLLNVHLK